MPPAFRSDFQYCNSVLKKWTPFLAYQPQSLRADLPPPAPTEAVTVQPAAPWAKDLDLSARKRGAPLKTVEESVSEETEAHGSGLRISSKSDMSQISNLSQSSPILTGLTGSKDGADRRRDDRVKYQQPVVLIDGLREFVTTTVDVSISGFRIEDPLPGDFLKVVRAQMDVFDLGLIELEAKLALSAREARDRFRVVGPLLRQQLQNCRDPNYVGTNP